MILDGDIKVSRAGNKAYSTRFSDIKPDEAYLQLPRSERAAKPYVNMFRVTNKDDAVPNVSGLHQISSMECHYAHME